MAFFRVIVALAFASAAVAGPTCPTQRQLDGVKRACSNGLSPSCKALQDAVIRSCGRTPIVLAKIAGACGLGAACGNPVGRPTDIDVTRPVQRDRLNQPAIRVDRTHQMPR